MLHSNALRINGDRLWEGLMELASIGATPKGGVCRLALTEIDRAGRDWLRTQCEKIGMTTRTDAIGNLFARMEGKEPNLPAVLTGSHLDTQPTGGKFDGAFGVLAGLEVARTLYDNNIVPRRSLEIVSWTNEEGSRFLPVMAGSGVFAGVHRLSEVLAQKDSTGISFADALQSIGEAGPDLERPLIDAYFEAHIEQGPILEAYGECIGIVTGALGQRWFECTLTGFEAHAGPTPMELRRDAMQGAAAIIRGIDIMARNIPDARATIGMIECWPNSRNTIPGRVTFSIDLRHGNLTTLHDMELTMRELVIDHASAMKLEWAIRPTNIWEPCQFDPDCIGLVRAATADLDLACREMVSGAGHDAVNIARIAPTAMIFVPCRDGVSHNEIEDAKPSDLTSGANVLLGALLARLNR
jgi:beta-ureidopropionase / N-carbamoyl-L-amino-acid hydrolase